ncbi:hypothetical protein BURPSPAST_AA0752 [Burkholderia pseudomallei Pasteur 52237]|nr:hypothetical protein BURPSPAST_AA0752 [Burkholderia pseudomallei Pasteur 52237]EEC35179.1 hypothetical protein BUC_2014 [Burkholderia pseudomallei 576]
MTSYRCQSRFIFPVNEPSEYAANATFPAVAAAKEWQKTFLNG